MYVRGTPDFGNSRGIWRILTGLATLPQDHRQSFEELELEVVGSDSREEGEEDEDDDDDDDDDENNDASDLDGKLTKYE